MTPLARLSVFADHFADTTAQYITVTELAEMAAAPRVGAKKEAPLITPFESAHKRGEHAQAAMYAAVVIDHDTDNKTEAGIRTLYGAGGLDVCYLAFTSSHHQQEKGSEPAANRWKVVVPFARPVEAETAAELSAGIACRLASDSAQARKQQGFYAPSKLAADAPYIAITDRLGEPWEWLQPDDADSAFIREALLGWEALEQERQAKARQAIPKPRPASVNASAGIVGLILASYDLAYLLAERGYKRRGSRYLSPWSSSGIAGVVLLERDGKQVVYSHHGDTDPLSALNHEGHALDVADVLCALQYGGDYNAMIREEAAKLDPAGQKQRQREYMQQRDVTTAQLVPDSDEPARPHPLTRIVEIGEAPEPPAWLLPGFIAEGVVMIAGGHGVGKTTALLPLALAVAGIHPDEYELAPDHWRHVVYITEDTHQAQRIITGYGEWLDWPGGRGTPGQIKERLHIVEAYRDGAVYVALAGAFYREKFTRTVTVTGIDDQPRTVELLPLVVIDTLAATIHLENENDNSEASKAIATLKQQFEGLPVWIVGHTAKANLGRSDAITARGASAFEADANQVLYLVSEADKGRWLVRGKTRFESPWSELEIHSHSDTKQVINRFGQAEDLTLRWAIPTPPQKDRAQRSEQARAERSEQEKEAMRLSILSAVQEAFNEGQRLNRTAVRGKIGGRAETVGSAVDALLADGWLYEVEILKTERLKGKPSFLVALTEEERARFVETGAIPEYKLEIPPSWKKQPVTEPIPETC